MSNIRKIIRLITMENQMKFHMPTCLVSRDTMNWILICRMS